MKLTKFMFLLLLLILTQNLFSQKHRILLDEIYTDWENIPGISDSNDVSTGIDLYSLRATNYNNFLFLLLEMNSEINLQDANLLTLYIDTDNNSSTGYSINGIGAELEYTFGDRSGKFYFGNSSLSISHEDIGLVTMPTVTSNIFEINIKRNSIISGLPLFTDSTMRIIVKNNIPNGDIIPNKSGGYEYKFEQTEPQVEVEYSIKKLDKNDLRIISYNVERDRLFKPENKEAHKRIFQALNPDIIGFQEIYKHTAQQTADLIEEFLPSANGETWYSSIVTPDIIVVSRFPIKQSYPIGKNGAFIIDLSQKYNGDLLLINAHPPCCDNNDSRQKEIDQFMAFVRDAKRDGGVLTIEEDTPIVIVGDMNLVGYREQQTTLLTGAIVNNNIYGESFLPDWDSTYLKDAKPIATHMPSTFTWYDEGSSFSPGRLDYIVYSNSVISSTNSFVLFTNALPEDSLITYNLQSNDVTSVADHLPVVVDFKLPPKVSVGDNSNYDYGFSLSQNYPNPFNPVTIIEYLIPAVDASLETNTKLIVYDVLGREIETLINKTQRAGKYKIKFDGSSLTSGIYLYKLTSGENDESKKMLLMK